MKENDDCLISASRREGRGGRVRNGRVGGELWEVRPAAASACSVGATASVVGRGGWLFDSLDDGVEGCVASALPSKHEARVVSTLIQKATTVSELRGLRE